MHPAPHPEQAAKISEEEALNVAASKVTFGNDEAVGVWYKPAGYEGVEPFQIIQQFQRRLRDLAVSAIVAGATACVVGVAEQGYFDEDLSVAAHSLTKFDAAT
jgi:hypothetical protein